MGYYEIAIDTLTPLKVQEFNVPLQNRPEKQNKKQKKRGTLNFTVQYIPYQLLTEGIKSIKGFTSYLLKSGISEQLATSLLTVYSSDIEYLIYIFREAFIQEVENTPSSEQLFRTDSMATKLVKNGSKLFGQTWAKSVLQEPVDKVMNIKKSVEVDPSKTQPDDDISANMVILRSSVKVFMDAIINSLTSAPYILRLIASEMGRAVEAKFSDKTTQAIGGFLFLRFFCPAISSPDSQGLCTNPPDESKRHFLLVAKIIQSVVNNAPFTTKDPYLSDFNGYVTDMQTIIEANLKMFANISGQTVKLEPLDAYRLSVGFCQLAESILTIKFPENDFPISEYKEKIVPVLTAFTSASKFLINPEKQKK